MKEKGSVEMNDIEKKLEALKAEFLGKLEELKREEEMQKKQEEWKPWKPEYQHGYFAIEGTAFKVERYTNFEDDIDKLTISSGNCFPAKERAEQVAKKMRLLLRLEQLHDMLCPDYEPDWEGDRLKFQIYFSHSQGEYGKSCSTGIESPCMAVFDTEENAEKAAEILNKELEESK